MSKIKDMIKKPDEINDPPRPFMEHIYALRSCLINSAAAWFICAVLSGIFANDIMNALLHPAQPYLQVGKVQMRAQYEDGMKKTGDAPSAAPAVEKAKTDKKVNESAATEKDTSDKTVSIEKKSADDNPSAEKNVQDEKDGAQDGFRIATLSMTGGFNLIMTIAMWGGLVFGFPFILFFLLRFIFPALTNREKTYIMFFLGAGSTCFFAGASMAYFQLAPKAISFFYTISKWMSVQSEVILVEDYVPLILKLILAFGMVFQIPLILFILGWMGLVSSETLRSFRKFAIVIAFFLGMVLTPPDPMSQFLMALPLCLFYELSIWGVWLKERVAQKNS